MVHRCKVDEIYLVLQVVDSINHTISQKAKPLGLGDIGERWINAFFIA